MFVSVLSLAVGAAAQTSSQLDRVNVVRDTDNIRVEMSSQGAVAPKVSTLDSPARIVVDLPGTVKATEQKNIAVDAAGVKDVRIGEGSQARPGTRVVVDLEKACAYDLTPGPAGKLILTLHASTVAQAASQPKTVTANSAAPVSSTDYVFVEPSYQAKNDAKTDAPAAEPTVRAQEAAARFSDKTAAELLPASVHSAQAQNPAPAIQPAVNLAAEQKAQTGQQSVASGPKYTGEPISVNLKDVDLKDFFRLIHEISGLNVVLDPNVHGTLTIVLDDVPWDQALDIVLKNNDLARELEGNVLRIATVDTLKKEADARRAQSRIRSAGRRESHGHALPELCALEGRLRRPVKKFLSQRGDVVSDDRTNAVIISDIPNVIPTHRPPAHAAGPQDAGS